MATRLQRMRKRAGRAEPAPRQLWKRFDFWSGILLFLSPIWKRVGRFIARASDVDFVVSLPGILRDEVVPLLKAHWDLGLMAIGFAVLYLAVRRKAIHGETPLGTPLERPPLAPSESAPPILHPVRQEVSTETTVAAPRVVAPPPRPAVAMGADGTMRLHGSAGELRDYLRSIRPGLRDEEIKRWVGLVVRWEGSFFALSRPSDKTAKLQLEFDRDESGFAVVESFRSLELLEKGHRITVEGPIESINLAWGPTISPATIVAI
jgi:hypothetical protein